MAKHQRICSVQDCGKPAKCKGMCKPHYMRAWRHGDPLKGGTYIGEPRQFLKQLKPSDNCTIWPFARSSSGYAMIYQNGKVVLVSRLLCEFEYGAPPFPNSEAAHSCGNGHLGCVSPNHVRWADPVENAFDKIAHDTNNHGERHGMAVLTEDQVREIRALRGSEPQASLAARFGVAVSTICVIQKRRSWTHL